MQRCLLAGELESPLMPHTTTLEIMTLLDTIREEIGRHVLSRRFGEPLDPR